MKYRNWLIQHESTIGYSNYTEKWEGGHDWFSACIEKCFYSCCSKMQTENELISDLWNQYYICMLKWILLKTNSSEGISLYQWKIACRRRHCTCSKMKHFASFGHLIFNPIMKCQKKNFNILSLESLVPQMITCKDKLTMTYTLSNYMYYSLHSVSSSV